MKTNTTLFVGLFLCLILSFTTQIQAQNLNVEGNATATKFIGDGSMLTNIDKDTLNELQKLMLSGDTLMLSKDTTNVDLSAFINNWTINDGRDVSFGYENIATGFESSALGFSNDATGTRANAFGFRNNAPGERSSAFGYSNDATALHSSAFGYNTISDVYGLMAVGHNNTDPVGSATTWVNTDPIFMIGNGQTQSTRSTAVTVLKNGKVGIGTTAPTRKLEVIGNIEANVFFGDGSMLTNVEQQDLSLSGDTLNLTNDATNVDLGAFINNWTTNDGRDAVFGYNNLATEDSSSAFGYLNQAIGDRSSATGYKNEATASNSNAFGHFNFATALNSSAFGVFNDATEERSSAFGYLNTAIASNSSAFGYSNNATGFESSAFGHSNSASASQSSAFGYSTISDVYGLMAVGRYNADPVGNAIAWVATDPIFVIGNGETNSTRSTAVTVLKNGSVGIGTQTPDEKLEVSSDDAAVTRIGVTNTSTGNATLRAKTVHSDYGWYSTGADNSFRLFDFNANLDRMVVDSVGKVGIGTSSPTQKLHVEGEGLVNSTSSNPTFVIQNDTEKADLLLKRGAATGGIQLNASGGALGLTGAAGGTNLIQFRTYGASYFNGGNVGIGTTNPDVATLTVKSESGISIATRDASSGNYWAVGTGNPSNNYKFSYNAANNFVADIDAITGAYNQLSDRNMKKNIEQLEEVLPRVMQLNPTRYHFKGQKNAELKSWGFVAQEVEQIFPSFVSTTIDGSKEQKGIAYYNFSVLAIKAIQELKGELEETKSSNEEIVAQNEALQQKNEALEARLSNLEAKMEAFMNNCCQIESLEGTKIEALTSASLQQNAPNPFTEATNINYFIPEGTKNASLQVMDQNGRIIKTIPIQATGEGQITLQANLLSAGTYSYSLILDGQVMETKQMVLTH